jgi:hypothetical protein
MTTPSIQLDPRAKDSFWQVVADCLVEFHSLDPTSAQAQSDALRQGIAQSPPGICGDIIYHDEPFDVACDIAGKKLDLARYRGRYDLILQRHNW